MLDLNGENVLITGGTGSFGKAFVKSVLQKYPKVGKLVVFSRDELKQYEMALEFPTERYHAMRYFIGDVRDGARLERALEGIDIIVHAAALKQVPTAEYNPFECIKTNILGAQNLIDAALNKGIKKVVALSTDKAAAPINLYGATKLCSDKLFVAANNIKGKRDISFSVVRYGNVMGSRGSVIPFFMKQRETGVLPITNTEMTRFNISLEEGVDMVLYALENAIGGEIFVPKIPSYKITDVATAIGPDCEQKVVGVRPGEKIHEEMITETDSLNTLETEKHFIIVSNMPFVDNSIERYMEAYQAKRVPENFRYSSGNNHDWLSVEQIRKLIKQHIDPNFKT